MNKILILFSLTILSAHAHSQEIIQGPFLIRYGVTYQQNTNALVTGVVVSFRENGQLESKVNYKDGKKDGFHESFYEKRQLRSKENHKDGKKHGLSERYHENGQLAFKGCFKNDDYIDMSYCEK